MNADTNYQSTKLMNLVRGCLRVIKTTPFSCYTFWHLFTVLIQDESCSLYDQLSLVALKPFQVTKQHLEVSFGYLQENLLLCIIIHVFPPANPSHFSHCIIMFFELGTCTQLAASPRLVDSKITLDRNYRPGVCL